MLHLPLSVTIPFLFTGVLAAWKQLRVPGASRIASTVETVSAMSWRSFRSDRAAFQRKGFCRIAKSAGRRTSGWTRMDGGTVCCKRWKAASHGVKPLRELDALRQAQGGHEAVYVALGVVSDNARRFAQNHKVRLIQDVELTGLLRLRKGARPPAKLKNTVSAGVITCPSSPSGMSFPPFLMAISCSGYVHGSRACRAASG